MGLDINTLRFLAACVRDGVDLGRTVTIGRQGLFIDARDLLPLLRSFDRNAADTTAERITAEANGFCEPLLRFLGARDAESIDISPYQGATIIHDMNEPLPQELRGSFSSVIDGGSLEHVFNFPQAVRNCMEMVKVGGDLLCMNPSNNFAGHGFYQFSPELRSQGGTRADSRQDQTATATIAAGTERLRLDVLSGNRTVKGEGGLAGPVEGLARRYVSGDSGVGAAARLPPHRTAPSRAAPLSQAQEPRSTPHCR